MLVLLIGFIYGIKFKFQGHLPKTYFPTSWLRQQSAQLGGALRDFQSDFQNCWFHFCCRTWHLGGFGGMENTPTWHADDLPTFFFFFFKKYPKSRSVNIFSAAGFCFKKYKRFDLPAKAPPRPVAPAKWFLSAIFIVGASGKKCIKYGKEYIQYS